MDFPQQHEVLFPGIPFHVAHEPRNATGNRQPNEGGEDVPPPPVENVAAQAQPQGLQDVDMGYYYVANDYPPPQGHRDHIIADNARIVQDVPAQAHVAPPAPDIVAFNDEIQEAAAGPAPAYVDELPNQVLVPARPGRGQAYELLRELATLYLHDPNFQVAGIRMELGPAGGVMVVIILIGELPHQVPVPNGRASEALRQLSALYLHDPNSQIAEIHMEPGRADGVMVIITVRLTDL